MPITVAMIEEKEFKTKVRGYDPVEVDEFLDEICDEMIVMQEEISSLQGRLAQVSRTQAYAPASPIPAPVAAPAPQRDVNAEAAEAAQKILARAQRMYDDTVADAKREAADILAKAQSQADDAATRDLSRERDELQAQIESLRSSARAYRAKLIQLMQEQRAALDSANL